MSTCRKPANEPCRIHNPQTSKAPANTNAAMMDKINSLFNTPENKKKVPSIQKVLTKEELKTLDDEVKELANDACSVYRYNLEVRGAKNYFEISCNNESDLNMFFVVPEEGEPFSVFDYGIHRVAYEDGKTVCILSVPEKLKKPYDFYLKPEEFADCVDENENYDRSKTEDIIALLNKAFHSK